MAQDWDTLILLDACRFDDFKKINDIEGELKSKISKGVDSKQFIKRNFIGRELHDTIYVTANPHVKLIGKDVFYDVVTEPLSNWDSEIQCVHPEVVTNIAIQVHKKYPNKRIIVHYMQPHDPPLGPTANELRQRTNIGGNAPGQTKSNKNRIMELVAEGKISEDVAHQAYQETLKIVLDEVETLIENISGKTVISADHGEMFGEAPYPLLGKLYEHYRNPKTIQLCKVPWFVVDSYAKRREIISEKTQSEININAEKIENQLEALGYK